MSTYCMLNTVVGGKKNTHRKTKKTFALIALTFQLRAERNGQKPTIDK